MSHVTHLPIAIVGGGLGGLILARILHINGVHTVVFESDVSSSVRSQGGMLDLHENNGQLALKEAGLFEKFLEIIRPGAQAYRVLNKHGQLLTEAPDDGSLQRPEVKRSELRQILLDSLPEETLKWGFKLKEVSSVGSGKHLLTFTDGSVFTTDLVIGADGAWSKVRALVSAEKPIYSGTTYIEAYLYDVGKGHKAEARLVGNGAMYAFEPGKGIISHREPGDVIHTYVALPKTLEWVEAIKFTDAKNALSIVAEEFRDWAPELRCLITEGDVAIARPLFTLPSGFRWNHLPGVTLLGDAAHLMLPTGEGANLAMLDGCELAKIIVNHQNDLDAALISYEESMFERSAVESKEVEPLFDILYGENAPQSFVEFMT